VKSARALRTVLRDPANAVLVAQSKKQGLVKKRAADSILRTEFLKDVALPITEIQPQDGRRDPHHRRSRYAGTGPVCF
jgi:hypothetical protein